MRVAIFTETYLPYLSGVTVSTEALARGLGRAGHDVLMVAPRPKRGADPGSAGAVGPDPTYAWLPSYEPVALVPPGYRMPIPVAWTAGRRAAIAFAPQIVHAQSPFASGLLADEVSRRLHAPWSLPTTRDSPTTAITSGHSPLRRRPRWTPTCAASGPAVPRSSPHPRTWPQRSASGSGRRGRSSGSSRRGSISG